MRPYIEYGYLVQDYDDSATKRIKRLHIKNDKLWLNYLGLCKTTVRWIQGYSPNGWSHNLKNRNCRLFDNSHTGSCYQNRPSNPELGEVVIRTIQLIYLKVAHMNIGPLILNCPEIKVQMSVIILNLDGSIKTWLKRPMNKRQIFEEYMLNLREGGKKRRRKNNVKL